MLQFQQTVNLLCLFSPLRYSCFLRLVCSCVLALCTLEPYEVGGQDGATLCSGRALCLWCFSLGRAEPSHCSREALSAGQTSLFSNELCGLKRNFNVNLP